MNRSDDFIDLDTFSKIHSHSSFINNKKLVNEISFEKQSSQVPKTVEESYSERQSSQGPKTVDYYQYCFIYQHN